MPEPAVRPLNESNSMNPKTDAKGWASASLAAALLVATTCATAADSDSLFAAATEGSKVAIGTPGHGCRLGNKEIRRRLGLDDGSAANYQPSLAVLPALAVADPKDPTNTSDATSRLVVVDLGCKISQSLKNYYAAPPAQLYPLMAEAVRAGYLDAQGPDGKWGSWNLRTDRWDPPPCCAAPAHSAILAAELLAKATAEYASSVSQWTKIWELLRPIVLAYAVVAGICMMVAASFGHRGAALVGHGLVVMPLKAVWLAIVLVVAANLYALAGLLGSGGLTAIASGTVSSATRAWRK